MRYERLVNEATQAAAQRLLERLPPEQRREMEAPVHEEIRAAVVQYADSLAQVARQLLPLGQGRSRT